MGGNTCNVQQTGINNRRMLSYKSFEGNTSCELVSKLLRLILAIKLNLIPHFLHKKIHVQSQESYEDIVTHSFKVFELLFCPLLMNFSFIIFLRVRFFCHFTFLSIVLSLSNVS